MASCEIRYALAHGLSVTAMFMGALPVVAAAQVAAPPTREEVTRPGGMVTTDERPSRLTVEGGVEHSPCPLAAEAYSGLRVSFAQVEFANLQGLPASALEPAWRDMAGRELPLASLCEVRDRAATILRNAGYLAAVQVPPQRIEKGGTVRMDVLMARLTDIQVRGDAGNSERLIAAHLRKLTQRPLFNVREAERQLLLARDLPGFDVRLTLRPAAGAPGDVVGDITVARQPYELVVATQNLGSRTVGREGVFAQFAANDLLGHGDRAFVSLYNTVQTSEQTVLQLGYETALNADGLRLTGNFIRAWTKPGLPNRPFTSDTKVGTVELRYPIARRQAESLHLAGGFDLVDQDLRFGGGPVTRDRLRVLYARLDYDAIDPASVGGALGYSPAEPRWRTAASVELRQGVDGLGASPQCRTSPAQCAAPAVPTANVFGDPSAFLVRWTSQLEYRPTPQWTLALSPRAQLSNDALLPFEQFSAGNYTAGRGFDPGSLTGDDGFGLGAELRWGRITPGGVDAIAWQPFVFYDTAWTWRRDLLPGRDRQHLHSAGGGVRVAWGNHGRAELTFAAPLDRLDFENERRDARLLFNLVMQLVPWSAR